MNSGEIIIGPKPYIVQIVRGGAKKTSPRRSFAFIHKRHSRRMRRGGINESMVQMMLCLDWEHSKLGELPQLEISMLMHPSVSLYKKSNAEVLWDRFEGGPETGKHWIGIQMNEARHYFMLDFKDPVKNKPSFHAFFYREWRELHIFPDFNYRFIADRTDLFLKSRVLKRLKRQVHSFALSVKSG